MEAISIIGTIVTVISMIAVRLSHTTRAGAPSGGFSEDFSSAESD